MLKDSRGSVSMRTVVFTAVLLILTAVCVLAFLGYVESSYMVKADRTAQKAYEAASEYLAKLKQNGTLDEFNVKAKHFGKALSMDLQEKILRENYKENDVDEYAARYRKKYREGDVRYLFLEGEQSASENRSDNPLLAMFEYAILDDNLLQDTFLVEYNSKTGKVLAVFYSGESDLLNYEGNTDQLNNVILRTKETLKQKKQGYCGVSLHEIIQ